MDIRDFDHISKCWQYLDQFKTLEELEDHLEDLPLKFGTFDITNEETAEQEGFAEVRNTYWDDNMCDWDYAYHTVLLDTGEEE